MNTLATRALTARERALRAAAPLPEAHTDDEAFQALLRAVQSYQDTVLQEHRFRNAHLGKRRGEIIEAARALVGAQSRRRVINGHRKTHQ